MCLAVPGRVVGLAGHSAVVEVEGKQIQVRLDLMPEEEVVGVGDYLVFHLGMALARIEEEEAMELMEMLNEIAVAENEVAVR